MAKFRMANTTSRASRNAVAAPARTGPRPISGRARAIKQLAISLSALACGAIALPEVSGGEYAPLSLLAWCAVAGLFETMSGRSTRLRVLPFAIWAAVVTIVVGASGTALALGLAAVIHGCVALRTALRMPITGAARPAAAARTDKGSAVDRKTFRGALLERQPFSSAHD